MGQQRIAALRLSLKGYVAPDTAQASEGRVAVGRYWVLEEKEQAGDFYARLELSGFPGGDAWICTSSKGVTYADVLDAPPPEPKLDFGADDRAIEESKLTGLFASFNGFLYDLHDGQYPYELPGVRIRTDKKQNNCCTFVEALTVKAFEGMRDFTWSLERHNQMMINGSDRFSPVTAAVESGMAVPASSPDTPPQPWSIVQGWRSANGGHTFLIVDHDRATDRVLMLESNHSNDFMLNGPGYRCFGALEGFGVKAPPGWSAQPVCWTWERVCKFYPERLHAALKVKNRSLSGL